MIQSDSKRLGFQLTRVTQWVGFEEQQQKKKAKQKEPVLEEQEIPRVTVFPREAKKKPLGSFRDQCKNTKFR